MFTFFLFPDSGLFLLNGFDFYSFRFNLNGVTLKTSNITQTAVIKLIKIVFQRLLVVALLAVTPSEVQTGYLTTANLLSLVFRPLTIFTIYSFQKNYNNSNNNFKNDDNDNDNGNNNKLSSCGFLLAPYSAHSRERKLYDGEVVNFLSQILTLSYIFCLGYF